jgi:hypothetical protein
MQRTAKAFGVADFGTRQIVKSVTFPRILACPFLLSLISTVVLSGCGGGVVYQIDPQTHQATRVAKFSRAEEFIYYSIDSSLAEEKGGKRPSGGVKTWHEYWRRSISAWREAGHSQYETYFIRRRAQVGLRPL